MNPNRHIFIDGDAPLPPSRVPVPPADMQLNEVVMVHPPGPIHTREGSDYFQWDLQSGPLEFYISSDWVNEPPVPPAPPGDGRGFAQCEVPARYRMNAKAKSYRDAIDINGTFCAMSPRLVTFLRDAVGDAIDVLPVRFERKDGTLLRDDYFFVDVVRRVTAIDWANSVVEHRRWESVEEHVAWPVSIRTLDTVPADALLFRDDVSNRSLIHRSLVERLMAVKPKFTGLSYAGTTKGFSNAMTEDWPRVDREREKTGGAA